ncbi:hypothetical protein [Bacillus cereus group sp. N24]|uniref:hypothetical protein n=1 Tax=Bacillus cereus group sp. N24 TaxID=2794592 RepID=UPI0018F7A8A7|nr:hypothetical protein [Bacillus cereus group sp. N24]MBJ7950110.1 hypothetical protein [Bacillus cereus group sp. N24]
MENIEKDLIKHNNLKTVLLSVARCIDCCEEKDVCFYQDLAITYSEQLKKFTDFIKQEYGVDLCCNQCLSEEQQDPERLT